MQVRVSSGIEGDTAIDSTSRLCILSPSVATNLGVTVGEQIRIVVGESGQSGAFTVRDVSEQNADVVLGRPGGELLHDSSEFTAQVFSTVPRTDLSYSEARRRGEVTETVWHEVGSVNSVVVCAPHAGNMEENTARAAAITARAIGVERCSAWLVEHFQPDPFDRWHVTSTRIHRGSYPGLETVASTRFDRAVSFHLYDGSDEPVIVGGRADQSVRADLARRIEESIGHVRTAITEDGEHMGKMPGNFVNWLTEDGDSGIQIEMPPLVAKEKCVELANAVAAFVEETDLSK